MVDGQLFPDLPQSFPDHLRGFSMVVNMQLLQTGCLSADLASGEAALCLYPG